MVGPGSEWLWAMVEFFVVALGLIGVYRQLRQQNAANALHRMEALQGEWQSARLSHARLVAAIWRKHSDGRDPDPATQMAIVWVGNFFENLADLYGQRYISWAEVEDTWGASLVRWWIVLRDPILELSEGGAREYPGFQGLAERALEKGRKRGEKWAVADQDLPRLLDFHIAINAARLRMLRDIELGVIPEEPAPRTPPRESPDAAR